MHLLECLSWKDVEAYLTQDDRIIIPLGAVEEHGLHLGLGTDFLEAKAIAEGVGKATGVLVAPTLNYGVSLAQMGFPGTMSLRPATLIAVLEDLIGGLYQHGFRRILIVNGHGGNQPALVCAVQTLAMTLPGLRCKNFQWWTDREAFRVVTDVVGDEPGSHATFGETSFMMAICPEGVDMSRLSGDSAPVKEMREMYTVRNFRQFFPDGIMGIHPATANADTGRLLLQKSIDICIREAENWQV